MLDLKLLRNDPDAVRAALARRGDGSDERLDAVLALDERRRDLLPRLEGLRAEQNEANAAIARAKQEGSGADEAIARMREVAGQAKALGEKLGAVEEELQVALAALPNLPDPTAADEDTVIAERGVIPERAYEPLDHLALAGERHVDFAPRDRAAQLQLPAAQRRIRAELGLAAVEQHGAGAPGDHAGLEAQAVRIDVAGVGRHLSSS